MGIINTRLLTPRNVVVIFLISAVWHVALSPIFAHMSKPQAAAGGDDN